MFSENEVCLFGTVQTSECLYRSCGARVHLQGRCWVLVVSAREGTSASRCDFCTCALGGEHSCTSTPAVTSLVTRVTGDSKHLAVKTLGVQDCVMTLGMDPASPVLCSEFLLGFAKFV